MIQKILKKFLALGQRRKSPASKIAILSLLRFQLLFLGVAFIFVLLDLFGVFYSRSNALFVFIFLPLAFSLGAYLHIREVGFEHNESN